MQVITDIQHFANFTHSLNQSNHKGYYNDVFFVIWFFISQFRLVYSHTKADFETCCGAPQCEKLGLIRMTQMTISKYVMITPLDIHSNNHSDKHKSRLLCIHSNRTPMKVQHQCTVCLGALNNFRKVSACQSSSRHLNNETVKEKLK